MSLQGKTIFMSGGSRGIGLAIAKRCAEDGIRDSVASRGLGDVYKRQVHTLTPEGKKALRAWSKKPARQPSIKDDMLVKFYALENMDLDALKDQPVSYTHLTLPTTPYV